MSVKCSGQTTGTGFSFHTSYFSEHMRIPFILTVACFLGGMSLVHMGSPASLRRPERPEPAENSPAGDTVDKSLSPASVNGIRFVLKTPMTLPEVIYMPIDGKRLEKVELRAALPGRRSVYPRSKIITLFGGVGPKGMPTNKLVSKPLPDNLGPKTLALVGKNSKGEFTLDFINEAELPMNCIYIQNLTGRTFTLELPNPPMGEKSAIELPSMATYVFGKDVAGAGAARSTPANLTYMARLKDGKSRQGQGTRHDADHLSRTQGRHDHFSGCFRTHRRSFRADDFQGKNGCHVSGTITDTVLPAGNLSASFQKSPCRESSGYFREE